MTTELRPLIDELAEACNRLLALNCTPRATTHEERHSILIAARAALARYDAAKAHQDQLSDEFRQRYERIFRQRYERIKTTGKP